MTVPGASPTIESIVLCNLYVAKSSSRYGPNCLFLFATYYLLCLCSMNVECHYLDVITFYIDSGLMNMGDKVSGHGSLSLTLFLVGPE